MTKLLERLREFACAMRGHETVLHFEPDRLALRCLSCGHQTPGWTLTPRHRTAFAARSVTGFRKSSRVAAGNFHVPFRRSVLKPAR